MQREAIAFGRRLRERVGLSTVQESGSVTDIVRIGDATLYHADCRDVLPTLPKFDLLLTDPPYGLGVDRSMAAASGTQYGAAKARKGEYVASGWDDEPLSSDDASLLIGKCGLAILWAAIITVCRARNVGSYGISK